MVILSSETVAGLDQLVAFLGRFKVVLRPDAGEREAEAAAGPQARGLDPDAAYRAARENNRKKFSVVAALAASGVSPSSWASRSSTSTT